MRFWAVGREGEYAVELLKDFLRERPDIEVEVQKMPWTAAHEKLLTAYAGETLPDLCSLGNTWIPEFTALSALTPLDELARASRDIALDDYFPGILDSNRVDGPLFGIPWYVDTSVMYYRRDLLQQAGFNAPPTTWDEWTQMLGAIKTLVGADRYSILLPLNEFWPLVTLSLQHACGAAARPRALREFPQRRFPPHAGVLREHVPARMGAEDDQHAGLERLGRVRPRHVLVLHLRAVEHRGVQKAHAARRCRMRG